MQSSLPSPPPRAPTSESQSSPATYLPYELLHHIFIESVPRLHAYDPSVSQGPHSSWLRESLRTKKILPLVCRAWHAPATDMLYSDIVLRRMGQILALAGTLRTTADSSKTSTPRDAAILATPWRRDLAVLIRRIRIDTLIVFNQFGDVLKDDFAYILIRTTRLSAFEFHLGTDYPLHDQLGTYEGSHSSAKEFIPSWIFPCTHRLARCARDPPIPHPVGDAFHARLSSGIRELDVMSSEVMDKHWDCQEAIMHVYHVLRSAASTLVLLKLGALEPGGGFERYDELYATKLVFPVLEELYLRVQDSTLDDYVCRACVLPRLTWLTLVLCSDAWPDALLSAHGRHLRYLHLYPGRLVEPTDLLSYKQASSTLAKQCPDLQHLVLPGRPSLPLALRHPSLRHVDVWSATVTGHAEEASHPLPPDISDVLRAAVVDDAAGAALPALRTVRVLLASNPERALGPVHVPACRHVDWPVVCHPDAALDCVEGGLRLEVFAGAWAVQTAWGVLSLCHPLFHHQGRARAGSGVGVGGQDADAGEEDLPDGIQVDEEMLRAVLEEQGLDSEYVPPDEDPDSDAPSERAEEDDEDDAEWHGGMDLISERGQMLEAFRRGQM